MYTSSSKMSITTTKLLHENSLGITLWVLLYGYYSLGITLWVLLSGYYSLGITLWVLLSGYYSMGITLWVLLYGYYSMGYWWIYFSSLTVKRLNRAFHALEMMTTLVDYKNPLIKVNCLWLHDFGLVIGCQKFIYFIHPLRYNRNGYREFLLWIMLFVWVRWDCWWKLMTKTIIIWWYFAIGNIRSPCGVKLPRWHCFGWHLSQGWTLPSAFM